jgi:hypothetical protein
MCCIDRLKSQSEADISQGWLEIKRLGSAYGHKQTLATQKETRREAGS